MDNDRSFSLSSRHGTCVLTFPGDQKEHTVQVVYARPKSARGSEICFMDKDKKEVAMVKNLDALDEQSRRVAREELDRRYLITRISRVNRTRCHFGIRFWDVDTERGSRSFALKEPHKNVDFMDDGSVFIRDTLGNCYEIPSFDTLDRHSREQVDRMI